MVSSSEEDEVPFILKVLAFSYLLIREKFKMLESYSRRQLLTLAAFGIADFFNACCVSLQAPFFPMEAQKKGASATEYGIVFGIFELVVFLVSPFYGKKIRSIGPKKMFYCGILTSGLCSILFGLLDWIQEHYFFIYAALLIRIVEALGNAAFLTASFSIIAHEFPENMATTFASLETCFGLGMIAGPLLGGVLYAVGGFPTPFMVLGAFLFLTALCTKLALPASDSSLTNAPSQNQLLEVLKIRGMPICAATILSTSTSISFLSATLEPHLRQFHIKPVFLGFVFVVTGATYGASAPAWGWLCDKYGRPKALSVFGGIILILGVSLVGPAPYLPLNATLTFVIIGLFLHGLGIGARLVSSFCDALQTALAYGLPNDIDTYGLISGLWTSSFALGAFIGPTVSGFLFDTYGFADASLFIIILVLVLVICEIWYLIPSAPAKASYSALDSETGILKDSSAFLSSSASRQTLFEKPIVSVGSDRVLNLIYKSESDLTIENEGLFEERTPLLHDD